MLSGGRYTEALPSCQFLCESTTGRVRKATVCVSRDGVNKVSVMGTISDTKCAQRGHDC